MLRRALAIVLTVVAAGAFAPARAAAPAAVQTVSGARVAAVAERLARTYVHGADRVLVPAFTLADQRVPLGAVTLEPAGHTYVSATYISVPVAMLVDGSVVRTVLAGYRVTTYISTAVAAHDLAMGTVLSRDDLSLARVAANGRPAVKIDALLGRKLIAATNGGSALYPELTIPDTIVKPGQPAILIVHDGSIALTADVVARTGGALGDVVTVFNPDTQKAIAAVVTGRDQVEITLPGGHE